LRRLALFEDRLDKCIQQGHWFEFVDYVPDFDNRCYMLKACCEECGCEIMEKVSEEQKANKTNQLSNFSSQKGDRYWKIPIDIVVCSGSQSKGNRS
jgi:hypothetical protein